MDGSYNASKSLWGGGAYLVEEDLKIKACGIDATGSQNIAGELNATVRALEHINAHLGHKYQLIEICHDYSGIEQLALGKCNAHAKICLAYQTKMRRLLRRLRVNHNCLVTFRKVKAHSNDKFNNLVDKLSRKACKLDK